MPNIVHLKFNDPAPDLELQDVHGASRLGTFLSLNVWRSNWRLKHTRGGNETCDGSVAPK